MSAIYFLKVGLLHNIFRFCTQLRTIPSVAKGYEDKKYHRKHLCKFVLTIVLLELRLYFVNYNPVFRSYDCILGVKIVLLMQHKL